MSDFKNQFSAKLSLEEIPKIWKYSIIRLHFASEINHTFLVRSLLLDNAFMKDLANMPAAYGRLTSIWSWSRTALPPRPSWSLILFWKRSIVLFRLKHLQPQQHEIKYIETMLINYIYILKKKNYMYVYICFYITPSPCFVHVNRSVDNLTLYHIL